MSNITMCYKQNNYSYHFVFCILNNSSQDINNMKVKINIPAKRTQHTHKLVKATVNINLNLKYTSHNVYQNTRSHQENGIQCKI